MNIIDEITGFFTRLFRQKVNTVQSRAQAKVMGAQVKAKTKAAGAVNKKLDQAGQAAKAKAASKIPKKK